MSADINSLTIIGRLTKDSEAKTLQSGSLVGNFSIAVNTSKKVGDQWQDEGNFFDCQMWGKRAESLSQYLKKGTRVGISGELRQERWEQDGQTRSRVLINIVNIELLDSKPTLQTPPSNDPPY